MNCGTCKHWNLRDSAGRSYGQGLCMADPSPLMRAGRTLGPHNVCRIEKYEKADSKVISRREKEGAVIL